MSVFADLEIPLEVLVGLILAGGAILVVALVLKRRARASPVVADEEAEVVEPIAARAEQRNVDQRVRIIAPPTAKPANGEATEIGPPEPPEPSPVPRPGPVSKRDEPAAEPRARAPVDAFFGSPPKGIRSGRLRDVVEPPRIPERKLDDPTPPRRSDRLPTPPDRAPPRGERSASDFDAWKDKKDRKLVDELQEENADLTNLLTILPGLIRNLSGAASKREVAPILAETVQRVCLPPPGRVLVFFVSRTSQDLILAARLGCDHDSDAQGRLRIPRTFGRVGHAIARQLTMDARDFERDAVADAAPGGGSWGIDIAAPLVRERELLGAVCAGEFGVYNRNAKRLVGVAANLGSLAISLAEKTAQIQHQANSDALTGLYNRRFLFERLEREVEQARENRKPFSVFLFDIDHFKTYNDKNGHPAGDEALRTMGQLLNEFRRETDVAARYGGEEFMAVLPGTSKAGCYTFAERFRRAVESYPFPHGHGQPFGKVTISGGVATWPEDGEQASILVEAADACLYLSKERGRNLVSVHKEAPARRGPG